MYFCNECLFSTKLKHNYDRHCLTKKHIVLLNKKNKPNYFCSDCNKDYKHQSSFSRHKKLCNGDKKPNNPREMNTNNNISNLELKLIKKDYEHKLEIEKLKYKNQLEKKELEQQLEKKELEQKLEKKELEKQLEIKEIENKNLQLINNSKNKKVTNKINVEINNINICKLKYLNSNFNNVIDINTFIENYKTKFGLTNEQSLILLENSQEGGINSCISSLVYYLKESAIKQYKEIKGQEIERNDVVLPFLLSDKSLRDHFEKSINGKWDKTTMNDNIKKIVTITNDHVFKHHKQFINISGHQNKRLMNGILKASCYSLLSNITKPELYKINNQSEFNSQDNNILEGNNEDINNENNDNENNNDSDTDSESDDDEYNSDEEYTSDDDDM
jgi:hypothetical protein